MFKKIIFWLFTLFILGGVSLAQSSEDYFFYGDEFTEEPTTSINHVLKNDIVESNDGFVKRTLRLFNLEQFTTFSDASALEFATYIINIALGLITFIAVVIIIYGFAQIFFSKDDEGLSKAKKIVQNAAIAIAIIAVSWFIVTFLFNIYEQFIS